MYERNLAFIWLTPEILEDLHYPFLHRLERENLVTLKNMKNRRIRKARPAQTRVLFVPPSNMAIEKGYIVKTFPQKCNVHITLIFVGMSLSEADRGEICYFPTAPFALLQIVMRLIIQFIYMAGMK